MPDHCHRHLDMVLVFRLPYYVKDQDKARSTCTTADDRGDLDVLRSAPYTQRCG